MESYNIEKEQIAANYLAGSYVKIPRKLFVQMTSKSSFERKVGWFHLLLIGLCFHTDGYALLNKRKVTCRKGEYVGSYRALSEASGFSLATIGRLIKRLSSQGLIDVMRLEGGTHIRVCGYLVIAESRPSEPGNPAQLPATKPDGLSDASKNIIMREEDTNTNQETNFF